MANRYEISKTKICSLNNQKIKKKYIKKNTFFLKILDYVHQRYTYIDLYICIFFVLMETINILYSA